MEKKILNEFMFSWRIEKFRFVDGRRMLTSPVFAVDFVRRTKWCLSIRHDFEKSDAISIYLYRCIDDYPLSIFLNYNITIISGGNTKTKAQGKNREFKQNSTEEYGFKLIKRNELFPEKSPFFSENDILIECKMCILETESSQNAQLPHFLDSFEKTFNSLYEIPLENFDNLKGIEELREKLVQTNNLCSARTIIHVEVEELFWTIERFSALQKNEKKIILVKSSFSFESCAVIMLYLNDDDIMRIDVLVNEKLSDKYISLHCQVGVCDVYDNIEIKCQKMCYFTPGIRQSLTFEDEISKSGILSARDKFLDNEDLNLHFVLVFVSKPPYLYSVHSTSSKCKVLKSDAKTNPISRQMENIFVSNKHCDVTLKAQDQDIQAHKAVLCSMSPVLDAMFDADMKEKNTGVVHVTDVAADTLRALVRYMYTRDIDGMDLEECMELFAASDKYQVCSLTTECRKRLKSNLSVDNVCDILACSHTHNDDLLKTCAMEFVCRNVSIVFASEKWKCTAKKEPQLASEVILYVTTMVQKR